MANTQKYIMAKCKCNCMDLVNQRDTADDDHFIRLYECVECGDKQVDVYKIIESKHLGKNKKLISEFGF